MLFFPCHAHEALIAAGRAEGIFGGVLRGPKQRIPLSGDDTNNIDTRRIGQERGSLRKK